MKGLKLKTAGQEYYKLSDTLGYCNFSANRTTVVKAAVYSLSSRTQTLRRKKGTHKFSNKN